MYKAFFDEDHKEILIYQGRGIIGDGINGVVYQLNPEKCLKHIINVFNTTEATLKELMKLDLESYYKIYRLLYDRHNEFCGYIMKYYEGREIDVMTTPIDYILDNLFRMYRDIIKLSDKKILTRDIHSENIVLTDDGIIIIDADNYVISPYEILDRNLESIFELVKSICIDAMLKYHTITTEELITIRRLFNSRDKDYIYNELKSYKYPIDYVRKKSLEPIKYVMKKDIEC